MSAYIPQVGVPSNRQELVRSRSRMTNRVMRQNLDTGIIEFSDGIMHRHAALLMTFDDKVASYKEEPCKIRVLAGKCVFTYMPDFEVVLADGSIEYVEVKPLVKTVKPKTEARLIAIRNYLENKGYCFRVMTEVDIHKPNALISNLRFLEQIRRQGYFSVEDLTPHVPAKDLTLKQLMCRLNSQSMAYAMLAHKLVFFDLEKEINPNMTVTTKGGDQYAELY